MYDKIFRSLRTSSNLMDRFVPYYNTILKEVFYIKIRNRFGARFLFIPQWPSAANSFYDPPKKFSTMAVTKVVESAFRFAYTSETNENFYSKLIKILLRDIFGIHLITGTGTGGCTRTTRGL